MSAAKFLMALRFIGLRGLPHSLLNAKTFQAANMEITELWHALSRCKTHTTVQLGSLLHHERHGGEAGGSGWWVL